MNIDGRHHHFLPTVTTPTGRTFSNLANGSVIPIGNNTFQANYEGGGGHDFTLTVVP